MELKSNSESAVARLKWQTTSLVCLLFLTLIATFGYHYSITSNEREKLSHYSQRNQMVSQLISVIGLRAKVRGLGVAILTEGESSPLLHGEIMRRIGSLNQAVAEFSASEALASEALSPSMKSRLGGWHQNVRSFNESAGQIIKNQISADNWLELSNSLIEYELELNRQLLMPVSGIEWVRLFAELEQDATSLVHYAGQQRALVKALLIEDKPVSPQLQADLTRLNGNIEGYISKLNAARLLDSLPLDMKNSLVLFESIYRNELQASFNLILQQSRQSSPYSLSPSQWWRQASNSIDAAESIASNASTLMQRYLDELYTEQQHISYQVIAEAIVLFTITSAILGWLLMILFRTIKELNSQQAQNHNYYRAILNCPVGILICDPTGRVQFANENYLRDIASTNDEVVQRTLSDVLSVTDRSFSAQLSERIKKGLGLTAEGVCKTSDISYEARIHVTPIRDEQGENVVSYLAIVNNISEQKVLEKQLLKYQSELESEVSSRTAELAQSEARSRAIFDMAASAIITIDKQGLIRDINPAASKMFGYQKDQVIGQNISLLMPQPYRAEHDGYLKSYQRTGDAKVIGQNREASAQHRDGHVFPIQLSVSEVQSENDHFYVGMITDISDRKAFEASLQQAKEQAEQASDIKSSFLANISHEIRTPMNAIIGMTEVVLEGSIEDQQRKHLSIVLQSAKSLLEILNQVLDLAKLEDGSVGLSLTDFNFRGLINEVLSPFAFTAKTRKLDFVIDIDDALPPYFTGDTLRIRQVLSNLVGNAIKFTESGFVQIRIMRGEADSVRFEVIDSGIGIPDDTLASIFDSFTQADNSISRRFGGTGLGTTISQQLVELMGGSISVTSELGIGSTFRFEIPLRPVDKPAIPSNTIKPQHNQINRALHILVAEDQPANQELVKLRLTRAGHQVTLASDGREAIRAFREQHFDLILMDVHMPKADGFEATRSIRRIEFERNLPATPIVALSASVLKKEQDECRASGMDGFIAKPIDFALLQDTIHSFFSGTAVKVERNSVHFAVDTPESEHKKPAEQGLLPICDFNAGLELWGDEAFYRKALITFASTLPDEAQALANSVPDDLKQARLQIHTIKGAAANLKLLRLAEISERMEGLLSESCPDIANIRLLVKEVRSVAEVTYTAITERNEDRPASPPGIVCDEGEVAISLLKTLRLSVLSGQIDSQATEQLQRIMRGDMLDRLMGFIDAFDFGEAANLIDEILLKLESVDKTEALDEL
ncbi:PAS domain S-box protein [Marinobacterium jannaschii]|uniref:PAS domain S-box protein n=1 Tax=Marinobacterium jannaschii TaxID=64970 RepID=UPI0006849AFB|nr:PAS domain S-box protein [Marinobacterium jannaschii]